MSNPIEPYDMIQKTNIKEHNDMVNKINEIVDVINNTNLDTINTEITNIKNKDIQQDTEIANIKNKDTTQDTEIDGITKNLVSNVTATFDNPSRELRISLGREVSPSIDATVVIPASSETGQYSAGNGITINNYQIAVDSEVVALKTDIPVVPDVTEINNRLDTIDGEITGINADITNLTNKNTEQDTAINGKVAISQGIENAGKVLGIGPDGNVTPTDVSSGGEVWEEVDLHNWPTDWQVGDKVKIIFNTQVTNNRPYVGNSAFVNIPVEIEITRLDVQWNISTLLAWNDSNNYILVLGVFFNNFNTPTGANLINLKGCYQSNSAVLQLTLDNITTYVHKFYRIKTSA